MAIESAQIAYDTYIIYHKADLDGIFGGAALLLASLRQNLNPELLPMQYGDDIHLESLKGKKVMMVDFSLPREKMEWLNENTDFYWYDHHISAMKEMEGLDIKGARTTEAAGCMIAFQETWDDVRKDYPEIYSRFHDVFSLISRYDIWDNKEENEWNSIILPFQYAMRLEVGLDIHQAVVQLQTIDGWDEEKEKESYIDHMLNIGDIVLDYQEQQREQTCKKAGDIEIDGKPAIALLSAAPANSNAFASVYDPEKHDMMVLIKYSIKDKQYTVSLYSDKENVDCSETAKKYGGG